MASDYNSDRKAEIINLDADGMYKGESLWMESWKRLRRNKAALVGIFIIVLNIVVAVFADYIAPRDYEGKASDQKYENSAPEWVISLFPNMKAKGEEKEYTFVVSRVDEEAGSTVGSFEATLILEANTGNKDSREINKTYTGEVTDASPRWRTTFKAYPYQTVKLSAESTSGNLDLFIYLENSEGERLVEASAGEGGALANTRTPETGFITVNNDYLLGADYLGRDLLSRIIYGARVSLAVAFIGPLVSLIVGLSFGLVSGYFGGRVDNLMMRIVDVMYAFPTILLIILMMAYFRASFNQVDKGTLAYQLNAIDSKFGGMLFIFVGVGLTSWMAVSRLARGQVLSLRETEFVTAAISIGTPTPSIIFRHVLPNILGPIVVAETLTIPTYISFEAFLSFIGLGVNPPTPSWGGMIAEGAQGITTYPNQAIFPALALFFIMFAFNFLGDGLRDALDPRMKRE